MSAEDTKPEKMEQDVVNFGKEIERLERQRDMDMKLVEATADQSLILCQAKKRTFCK